MSLKLFSWSCLTIAVLALGFKVFSDSVQSQEAVSLFITAMIVISVGFNLVRRELAAIRRAVQHADHGT